MQERGRILIVDDDPALLRVASYNLEQEGYEVLTAPDGQAGLKAVFEYRPDLVILDVMLPRLDGFETCRRIRELTNVPILMLTARQQEEDIIHGLELGADDYLVKPFVIGVLIARVKALLRRAQLPPIEEPALTYQDDWLRIDLPTRIVEVNGKRVSLSATEFKLLALLLKNAGRILEFNQILTHVWGPEYRDEISYVRVYISHLRQKIEPDPESPTYIQTERQVGYRFVRAN
jgi:two-component system KDP operon response regulator KdpE